MAITNRDIVAKAQMSIEQLQTDGGYLPEATAKKFIRSVVNKAVLVNMVTVRPMASPQQSEPKIKFSGRILHAAKGATALPEKLRARAETDKVVLLVKEFKSEVRLDYDTIEDNIEGEALQATILDMMRDRVALDMDTIMAMSNSALLETDPDLGQFDGLFTAANVNVYDAGGATLQKDVLGVALKSMPQEYRQDKSKLVHLVPAQAELDYRYTLAERATVGGDKYLAEDVPVYFNGSPVRTIPAFPEDQGGTSDRGTALYTDPKNIMLGIWKNVKFETDRDISSGEMIIVARVRFDVKYQEKRAVVKTSNLLCQ